MATFERHFVKTRPSTIGLKTPYYALRDSEEAMDNILYNFSIDSPIRKIINGHVPVKVKKAKSPSGWRQANSHRRRLLRGLPVYNRHSRLYPDLQLLRTPPSHP